MYSYSVVIPTLNEEDKIAKLIETLKSQTYQPKEIILADISTDKTPEIAKRMGALVTEGAGDFFVGRARNNGAKLATGDVIFFFDADNLLNDTKYIETFLNEFEELKLDAGHSILVSPVKSFLTALLFSFYNLVRMVGPTLRTIFSDVGSGIAVKRSVFEAIGGFRNDIRNSEDIIFLGSLIKSGYKYRILRTKLETSDRRIRNKSPFLLLILFFLLPIDTFLKKRGYNSSNKIVHIIEKLYQMKKLNLSDLKKKYSYENN
ncbi:glycosyltransferase [bacterium]|nr:glycosyltransferase [bacterium]